MRDKARTKGVKDLENKSLKLWVFLSHFEVISIRNRLPKAQNCPADLSSYDSGSAINDGF